MIFLGYLIDNMNDEIQTGDIIFYVYCDNFLMLEVQKVRHSLNNTCCIIEAIDMITSTHFSSIVPIDLKNRSFFTTPVGSIFTMHENIAVQFFRDFIDSSENV